MVFELIELDKHYDMLSSWWTGHNKPIIPKEMLSEIGLILKDGNEYIAASWMFFMNKDLAQIGWTTTNPNMSLKKKHYGVNLVLDALINVARENNKKYIVSFSDSSGLTKIMKKKGLVANAKHDFLVGSL